ncbi:MAG: ATP-binding protein [Opitutaceae bacterium]|nr:ATP-binding protein [Opitutaceae bacterium]
MADLPLPDAFGDLMLIRQVWQNLLENALKYSRHQPVSRIQVEGRRENDCCIYSVTDNGIGFNMDHVGRLFRVFERLHNDDSIEGTGIGLATVRRIVERHGGTVTAVGRPGLGATFTFSLPHTHH